MSISTCQETESSEHLHVIDKISLETNLPSDLHHRCKCIFQAFPDQLQYYTSSKQPKETSSGKILYEQAYLMLQYLQNKFLLDRVAIIRGFANEQGLLETAMEILDISLMFWMKKNQLMGFSSGFDWIVRTLLFSSVPSFPCPHHSRSDPTVREES